MINFFMIGVDEQLEFHTYIHVNTPAYTHIFIIQEINNRFFLTVNMFRYDVATFLSHKSVESGDPVILHSFPSLACKSLFKEPLCSLSSLFNLFVAHLFTL